MSPLAFDKQGKPFAWSSRTRKLRVRLFRNPAARGTCCQVLDSTGSPLFVEADVDYAEFRRITGNVPGLYRLDQCDEDGVDVDGAPAGYLTVEPLRNGGAMPATTENGAPFEVNALVVIERLVAVHERIFASQADAMKQMVAQHGVLMNANSAAMHASAEIMRAPYRAPLAMPEPRNAGTDGDHDDDEQEDEGEDEQHEPQPDLNNPFNMAMSFIAPQLPEMAHKLGAGAVEKIVDAIKWAFGAKQPASAPAVAPAAMPAADAPAPPMPASAAPRASVVQASVAAGASSRPAPGSVAVGSIFEAYEPRFADAEGVEVGTDEIANDGTDETEFDESAPSAATSTAAPLADLTTIPGPANPLIANAATVASIMPTTAQFSHLVAIYQRLSPDDRAIAQRAVAQMPTATRSQWIAALSAKSVEEAVSDLRGVLAKL